MNETTKKMFEDMDRMNQEMQRQQEIQQDMQRQMDNDINNMNGMNMF